MLQGRYLVLSTSSIGATVLELERKRGTFPARPEDDAPYGSPPTRKIPVGRSWTDPRSQSVDGATAVLLLGGGTLALIETKSIMDSLREPSCMGAALCTGGASYLVGVSAFGPRPSRPPRRVRKLPTDDDVIEEGPSFRHPGLAALAARGGVRLNSMPPARRPGSRV